MKPKPKMKFWVTHEPTGAKIQIDPKYVENVKAGQKYPFGQIEEKTGRRCFTLHSLSLRWDYEIEDVMKLLGQYEIPVCSVMVPTKKTDPIDPKHILIFDEYIFAVEKKLKIKHKKIKSKELILQGIH